MGINVFLPSLRGSSEIDFIKLKEPRSKWHKIEDVGDMLQYYFPNLPARILLMPDLDETSKVKEYGCSVSISPNPEILEGSFRPDEATWQRVQEWIRKNYQTLISDSWGKKKLLPV